MIKAFRVENLSVQLYDQRSALGEQAAAYVAEKVMNLLEKKAFINMIFAAAPSQNEFLNSLRKKQLPWERINAFHMDEYIGLPAYSPQLFSRFLYDAIFGRVPFKSVNYLNGNAEDIEEEMRAYEKKLKNNPIDIVCMGIGENGHIAFNDPPVADFNDPVLVKKVELDKACRIQQVNDGCFKSIEEVPTYAMTLTIPALMSGSHLFIMVPGIKKAKAIHNTIYKPMNSLYPSTVLRTHPNAILFIDRDSASEINNLELL